MVMSPFESAARQLDAAVVDRDPPSAEQPVDSALGTGRGDRAARAVRTWTGRRLMQRIAGHGAFATMTVLALGVTSLAMLAWANQINNRAHAYFGRADTLMDLQTRAAHAYTLLTDGSRQSAAEREDGWMELKRAVALSEVLLGGGKSAHGLLVQPLTDSQLRALAQRVQGLLSELRTLAQQRDADRSLPSARSAEAFTTLLHHVEFLAMTIEKHHLAEQAHSQQLFAGIVVAWSCVLLAAILGLWSRERRRRAADVALVKANTDLEHQARELRTQREHLVEFVEERTTGLRSAIVRLQQEVVEREEAEEALRKSEEQYRMLVETMNEGLMVLDGHGTLTYVNDKFCELLGYSREELLGRPSADFLGEADRPIIAAAEHSDRRTTPAEVTVKRKDGEQVFAMVSPRAIRDGDRNVVGRFAVITDITEKVSAEADRMRTAHLVSLGEVAAGVAHEINNPINGVINYARILCNEGEPGTRSHEIANRIVREGRRIASTVRDLLLFARGGASDKMLVNVGDVLSDTLGLIGSDMKQEGIQILTTVPPDLPRVVADPHELQQVLMNTISNARYALNQKYPGAHEDKRLHVYAEHVTVDAAPYVRVTAHDRGVGIPAGIIDKIREPFFSTKPRGKGTGLGLSISDGIVRDHGGRLAIESVEGEFTRVIVDLPAGEIGHGQDPCDR
jgi:PAS domain S-box-containing protein